MVKKRNEKRIRHSHLPLILALIAAVLFTLIALTLGGLTTTGNAVWWKELTCLQDSQGVKIYDINAELLTKYDNYCQESTLVEYFCGKTKGSIWDILFRVLIGTNTTTCTHGCENAACILPPTCIDADGDGYGQNCALGTDCNDNNAAINPGATETCNGLDDNCNGQVDEGTLNACGTCGPTPTELCDQQDNDCDGQVDEGLNCEIPAPPPEEAFTVPGWDWSIPYEVSPDPYSGLSATNSRQPIYSTEDYAEPPIRYKLFTTSWRQLNPEEGVYNWKWIEGGTAAHEAFDDVGLNDPNKYKGVIIRLKASHIGGEGPRWDDPTWTLNDQPPAIPEWVRNKCRNTEGYLEFNVREGKQYAPLWNSCVQAEYQRLVQAFGTRGIPSDERLVGLYIGGVSPSAGEELSIGTGDGTWGLSQIASTTGMTERQASNAIADALIQRAAWLSQEFGDQNHKLAVTGYLVGDASYLRMYNALHQGNTAPIGVRSGGPEKYFTDINDLGFNSYADHNGYIISFWDDPLITDDRYFGGEVEVREFFLDTNGNAYERGDDYFRTTMFVTLSEGRNFLWTNEELIQKMDHELVEYWLKTAGKKATESPDAFSALYQFSTNRFGGYYCEEDPSRHLKNIEKGLYQRDIPGAETQPTKYRPRNDPHWVCNPSKYDPYHQFELRDGTEYPSEGEFTSRIVDPATGKMAFFVDPAFISASETTNAQVKVTFVNNGKPWRVQYSTAQGQEATADVSLSGIALGQEATATFTLRDFNPTNEGVSYTSEFPMHSQISTTMTLAGEDIIIDASPHDELEVRFVRIIKDVPVTEVPCTDCQTPSSTISCGDGVCSLGELECPQDCSVAGFEWTCYDEGESLGAKENVYIYRFGELFEVQPDECVDSGKIKQYRCIAEAGIAKWDYQGGILDRYTEDCNCVVGEGICQ